MKLRGLLLIGLSLVLGLVAVGWIRNLNKQGPAEAASAEIVVAGTTLNFGDHISAAALRLVKWPGDAVPQGAFMSVADAAGDGDRVVLRSIEAGEPVLTSKISGKSGRATLSTIIEKDMRAVTIRVNDATGVAGFVLPNDRVDVLLTRDATQDHPNTLTETLLQNVKVLAIDQEASERKDKPVVVKAVTLEVSPDDAQKLTLGGKIGTLSLALRNFADPQSVSTRMLSVHDLEPQRARPAEVPVAAEGPASSERSSAQVTILRGTAPTTYDVGRDRATSAAKPKPSHSTNSAETAR